MLKILDTRWHYAAVAPPLERNWISLRKQIHSATQSLYS